MPSNGWRITPPDTRLTDSSSGSSPVPYSSSCSALSEKSSIGVSSVKPCFLPSAVKYMPAIVPGSALPQPDARIAPCLMDSFLLGMMRSGSTLHRACRGRYTPDTRRTGC